MSDLLVFPQENVDEMFTELGELRVELDDDPLIYGPKRLNMKTAQVRRMLDRCEKLFLSVSQKLQYVRRRLRVVETDFDLAKKNLFANDPETRAGRSVSDRDAISAGKLEKEIREIHDLNLAVGDLDAVLVVIKAKRSDLKDTEGRLRDQIRLCSEEIGLGGRWGSRVPDAPAITGRPALLTATGNDIEDVIAMLGDLDGEIQLSRDAGQWEDPVAQPTIVPSYDRTIVAPIAAIVTSPTVVDSSNQYFIPPGTSYQIVESKTEVIPALVSPVPVAIVATCNLCGNQLGLSGGEWVCFNDHSALSFSNKKLTGFTKPVVDEVATEKPTTTTIHVSIDDVKLGGVVPIVKDMAVLMPNSSTESDVDLFLSEVTISNAPLKPEMKKLVDEVDIDSILDMFESI